METPTINKKKGKIRSVGVHPFASTQAFPGYQPEGFSLISSSAWARGQYMALHVPGSFTTIMPATVMPRKTSSDSSLGGFVTAGGETSAEGLAIALSIVAVIAQARTCLLYHISAKNQAASVAPRAVSGCTGEIWH